MWVGKEVVVPPSDFFVFWCDIGGYVSPIMMLNYDCLPFLLASDFAPWADLKERRWLRITARQED